MRNIHLYDCFMFEVMKLWQNNLFQLKTFHYSLRIHFFREWYEIVEIFWIIVPCYVNLFCPCKFFQKWTISSLSFLHDANGNGFFQLTIDLTNYLGLFLLNEFLTSILLAYFGWPRFHQKHPTARVWTQLSNFIS